MHKSHELSIDLGEMIDGADTKVFFQGFTGDLHLMFSLKGNGRPTNTYNCALSIVLCVDKDRVYSFFAVLGADSIRVKEKTMTRMEY